MANYVESKQTRRRHEEVRVGLSTLVHWYMAIWNQQSITAMLHLFCF